MPTYKSQVTAAAQVTGRLVRDGGPYKSSGGNFYVFSHNASDQLIAYKASSVTGSWSTADTSIAWDWSIDAIDFEQFGDKVIAVANSREGFGELIEEIVFDMSTDSWDSAWSLIDDATKYWSNNAAVSLCISNGATPEVVCAYMGPAWKDGGSVWDRVWVTNRTSAGSWDTPVAVGAGEHSSNDFGVFVLPGSAEKVHIVHTKTSDSFYASYEVSSNTIASSGSMSAPSPIAGWHFQSGCGYQYGSTYEIRLLCCNTIDYDVAIYDCIENVSDNLVVGSTVELTSCLQLTNAYPAAAMIYDGTTNKEYVLYTKHAGSSQGAFWTSRDGSNSPGAFDTDTLFDSSGRWQFLFGHIISRDGSTFFDAIKGLGTSGMDYWEIAELTAGSLVPGTQQRLMNHPNLRR